MLSTFSVTNDCKHAFIITREFGPIIGGSRNAVPTIYLKKKKQKELAKTFLTRFSIKYVQQVLLVLVSNDLHMSFV